MSYPNPREAPEEFSRLLNTFNLDIAVTAFLHSRNPPLPEPDGRLSEAKAQQWCDRMDTLLGKLHRATPSQPSHKEVIGSLSELCATTIVDLEARLAKQKLWDEAEAKGSEKRGPIARLVAEREEKEKVERFRKMEQDKRDIEAAQRDLEVKRQALRIAERAADVVMDDVDDDDGQVGVSGAEEPQGTVKQNAKRQAEEAARKRMPQTVHAKLCTYCSRSDEVSCAGPIGHACDLCWRHKKSCSNGGRRNARDVAVKVEPKSPGKPITFKRKAYSTTGTNSIGHLEPYDDELDPPQGSSKYQKTGAGETAVVRSNATTPPNNPHTALRLTRHSARSAKANSKKTVGELVERLGWEFQAIAKTCEGIAEAINMDT